MITTITYNSQSRIIRTGFSSVRHNYDNTDTNSPSPKGSAKRIKICRVKQIVPWLILFFKSLPHLFLPSFGGVGGGFGGIGALICKHFSIL